jgi:hypothetical protein
VRPVRSCRTVLLDVLVRDSGRRLGLMQCCSIWKWLVQLIIGSGAEDGW